MSLTAGSGSYSTSIAAAASAASSGVSAAGGDDVPSNRTASLANRRRSLARSPWGSGTSSWVRTASTPGSARALLASMETMRA